MMEIHLIRHGRTVANEKSLYCGHTDLPLSENGAQEIALLKSRGIYPPPAGIFFTSGLIRAGQTVNLIYGKVGKAVISDIAEYNFGLFEMKSYGELKAREDYKAWTSDKTGDIACPSGESKNQFERRVALGFAGILRKVSGAGCGSAFVVCHGGVIACIMESLIPDTKNFYEWQPEPGRGYTLIYDSEMFLGYKNI